MASPVAETVQRFLDALARVEDAGDAAPVRRALQTILHEAVEQIWAGDADAAARYLEAMEPAMPRIRAVLASLPEEPMADAARYAQMVMQTLRVADRALDDARIEADLTSVSSTSKREVLRVLYTKGHDQYLSRSDVKKHMSARGVSAHRIGQILDGFHALHQVTRVELTRRGGRAAHYRLAPAGRELCARLFQQELDTAGTDHSNALITESLDTKQVSTPILDPARQSSSFRQRYTLVGIPSSAPHRSHHKQKSASKGESTVGKLLDIRETIHFPRDLVFETHRDSLPELVAYLPDIESITVEQRIVRDDGCIELVNRWQAARTAVPPAMRPFITAERLQWLDYVTWDSKEHVCRWRTEMVMLHGAVISEGINYYQVLDENTMEVHLTGTIQVDATKLSGVPRSTAGKVARAVESGVLKVTAPRLRAVNHGLEQYIAERNAQHVVHLPGSADRRFVTSRGATPIRKSGAAGSSTRSRRPRGA